jgi:hypothetical protein
MTATELRAEISVELAALEVIVDELVALQRDLSDREPSLREIAAASGFLAQFYTGVENILKRICRHSGIELPTGNTWHVDLFQYFCAPAHPGLPLLFDASLASQLAPYRRFRHVVLHGYAFQIDWGRMSAGVAGVQDVFARFKDSLADYLRILDT